MTLAKQIAQFIEYLEVERNCAQTTIRNYQSYLARFQKWASLEGIRTLELLTLKDSEKYRKWLTTQGGKTGFKKNTFNYHLIALRSLLKYARKKSIHTIHPEKIFLTHSPARSIAILSVKEIESLLTAPLLCDAPAIIKKRDVSILAILAHTGITVSELSRLKRKDFTHKLSITIQGRKNKYRSAHISAMTKDCLTSYLGARIDSHDPLFIRHDRAFHSHSADKNNSSLFLTPRSIQRIVQKYAIMKGLGKTITPHTLRHSYAAHLLAKGIDIESVRSRMGHTNVATTQAYSNLT
ncbi:tyrosine-type recombinase/integrase [Candidatus Uhrbacteria bacterium]|nr:tyrosine-type recombinase/integrase [Candidatus Uhrbacteria bacterium]